MMHVMRSQQPTRVMIFSCYGNVLIKYSPPPAPPLAPLLVTRKWSPLHQSWCLWPVWLACTALCNVTWTWIIHSGNWTRSQGQGSDPLSPFSWWNSGWGWRTGQICDSKVTWSGILTHNSWGGFNKPLCECTQTHKSPTFILHTKECHIWLVCVCLSFYCDDDALVSTQFSWLKDYVQSLSIEMNRENI